MGILEGLSAFRRAGASCRQSKFAEHCAFAEDCALRHEDAKAVSAKLRAHFAEAFEDAAERIIRAIARPLKTKLDATGDPAAVVAEFRRTSAQHARFFERVFESELRAYGGVLITVGLRTAGPPIRQGRQRVAVLDFELAEAARDIIQLGKWIDDLLKDGAKRLAQQMLSSVDGRKEP